MRKEKNKTKMMMIMMTMMMMMLLLMMKVVVWEKRREPKRIYVNGEMIVGVCKIMAGSHFLCEMI